MGGILRGDQIMKPISKLIFVILTLCLIIPNLSYARDLGGGMPRVFTKAKTLPSGMRAEFSVVTLWQYNKEVKEVFDFTFSETTRIAHNLDPSNPSGDIARIVAAAGQGPVQVSKETMILLEHAKEIAFWSRGTYDPVVGDGSYHNLKINKETQSIQLSKAGLSINLKGIIDGFMADLFVRAAHYANLDDAMASVDGVYRAVGENIHGPWQITVTTSSLKKARQGMNVLISNYSVGIAGGNYYTPALDPRNNKPIKTMYDSVTILCEQAATAQAVAIAVYTGSKNEGLALIDGLGVKAILGHKSGAFEKVGNW